MTASWRRRRPRVSMDPQGASPAGTRMKPEPTMQLQDMVCVVTGAASGIGRATAIEMARRGAWVAASDIDDPGGVETVAAINIAGGRARYLHADMESPEDIRAL